MSEKHFISDETARFSLACLIWFLVLEIITALLFIELPQANREIMIGLGGTIVGALVSSANFYNKTGVGNDRVKDDTINKIVSTAASIQSQVVPAEPTVTLDPGQKATIAAAPDAEPKTE